MKASLIHEDRGVIVRSDFPIGKGIEIGVFYRHLAKDANHCVEALAYNVYLGTLGTNTSKVLAYSANDTRELAYECNGETYVISHGNQLRREQ